MLIAIAAEEICTNQLFLLRDAYASVTTGFSVETVEQIELATERLPSAIQLRLSHTLL